MTLPGTYRFRFRRVLPGSDPILLEGEPGYDRVAKTVKMGDGSTPWSQLKVISPVDPTVSNVSAELAEHIVSETPHPVYDDGPSLSLLYENAKV